MFLWLVVVGGRVNDLNIPILFYTRLKQYTLNAKSVWRLAGIRKVEITVVKVPSARQRFFTLVQITVRNADNNMATRFANAVPVLDGSHRVIQMLQHMGSVNVVKGIVSVFLHCGCIAIIFVVVNAIGQANGVNSIVGVNSAATNVNALPFDIKVVKSCCQSALVCFSCFSHF